MRRRTRGASAALLLACIATSAHAAGPLFPAIAPSRAGFSVARLERLDGWIGQQIAQGRKSGVVVLIARGGRIAYLKAYGKADPAAGTPMRVDDMFRLYSMTKPVTAVALLTLYEQGKFQLTDPLSRYLPAFKGVRVYAGRDARGGMVLAAPVRPITIEDVLRHTAGFTYGYFGDTPIDRAYRAAGIDYAKLDSIEALTSKLATMPLLYQPGERWVYSFSYDVLARLVERLSGMPFGAYCRKAIFAPLGMSHTVFGIPPGMAGSFPTVYSVDASGRRTPVQPAADPYAHFTAHPFGGSGLSSTPQDYLRFAEMLLNGGELDGARILAPATVALMTSDSLPPGTASWAPGITYGLGVSVLENPTLYGNLGSAGEYGWSGYATTNFFVDPHERLVGMVFTQEMPGDDRFVAEFQTLVYQALLD